LLTRLDTLIQQLDTLIARIRQYLDQQHAEQIGQFKAHFHTYGQGQSDASGPGEVFVVAEVLANTQELANSVVSKARVGMIVS
jgi:hypothetical protein